MSDKDTPAATEEVEDLSKLDDGSDFVGTEDEADDKGSKDDARERDESGRFKPAKTEKGGDDAGDKGEGKKATDKKAGGKKAADESEEEEVEDEAEEESEEDESEEEEDDGAKGTTGGRIRTLIEQRNKAREQTEALTARVAELEKQNAKAEKKEEDTTVALKTELEKLYEDVEELRADNKTKEAAKAQRRIDEIKDELGNIKAQATARRESFAVAENREYDRMLDFLEEARPVVKKGSEEFDPEIVKELMFQVRAYELAGMPPTKALRRACALMFVEDPFAPAPKKAADKEEKKEPGVKKTDVKKNADAAKKTPPKSERSESGGQEKKISTKTMTPEDWDALPESKKKELQGDFL